MFRNPRTNDGRLRQKRKSKPVPEVSNSPSDVGTVQYLESPTFSSNPDQEADALHASVSDGPHDDPAAAAATTSLDIERLCDLETIWKMVDDFISILYPLLPVVHLPSFRLALAGNQASTDAIFFSLLMSICAQAAVLLPRRFLEYRSTSKYFPYNTPAEFVHHCIDTVLPLRNAAYFEHPTPDKAAISYLLGYAATLAGIKGRSRLFWNETGTILKSAGVAVPENHGGWNHIESQLWKKLFWMWYIVEAHDRVGSVKPRGSVSWRPIPDTMYFNSEDIDALMPAEVDDEHITASSVGQQPSEDTPLVKGFNVITRIYLCFMMHPNPRVTRRHSENRHESSESDCNCCSHGPIENEIRALENLYYRVKSVLNSLPACLAPWQHGDDLDSIDHAQQWQYSSVYAFKNTHDMLPPRRESLGSMRANIHITQLWARYVLAERLFSLYERSTKSKLLYSTMILPEHEFLCDQLLNLLSNMNFRDLESNGVSITFKIRQIAALFLQYQTLSPEDDRISPSQGIHDRTSYVDRPLQDYISRKEDLAQRAQLYINKFMDILTRLDAFTFQDTQQVVWNATARQISSA